jgi:hypothetical protein
MRTDRSSLVLHAVSVLALAGSFAACNTGNEPVKLTPAQAAASTQPAPTPMPSAGTAAAARPNAPVNPHAGTPAATTPPKTAGALQYSVPEGWVVQIPSSNMRKAQFQLPKAEGDAEDAQLVLFHFGGEGGSKEANFERWSEYFTPADGSAPTPLARTTRTVSGMEVTEASVTGTLDTSKVQGMGPGKRENWGMLVAYVESPSGPYFARLLGPAPTVSRWEASFRQWIASLKPTSG